MFGISLEDLVARHTEEVKELANGGAEMFELFSSPLSDRERKIFEIAFANGYCVGVDHTQNGEEIEVLKD